MDTALFLLGIVATGFAPAATLFLKWHRPRVIIGLVWLAFAAVWLLAGSINAPHPEWNVVIFVLFFIGWSFAFSLILSRSKQSKESEGIVE